MSDHSNLFLPELMQQLATFKKYPKYQFERRIDAFIGFFLTSVLLAKYDFRADYLWPEYPVRAHEIKKLSSNIDYACFDKQRSELCFIELKTDRSSVKSEQIVYYQNAMEKKWEEHINEIKWIASGSNQKPKYDFLLDQLKSIEEPNRVFGIYLAPANAEQAFWDAIESISRDEKVDSEKEKERWKFLSLEEFASTEIVTKHSEAWKIVGEGLIDAIAEI